MKEVDKWSVAPEVITVTARQGSPWKAPVSSTARRGGGCEGGCQGPEGEGLGETGGFPGRR